jgi:DNA polymerase III subunit beta
MKFTVSREALLRPLQLVAGVVEKRSTMPVLSNVLIQVMGNQLVLTGTDTEVEMIGRVTLVEPADDGEVTVPAKKLLDLCKSLPDDAFITFTLVDERVLMKSGRSRYNLTSLSADGFPNVEEEQDDNGVLSFVIRQGDLKQVIDSTSFSMAQQDVRYYLNGMLFELEQNILRTVSTDGHRLAMGTVNAQINGIAEGEKKQIIVPRKGVMELVRLLNTPEDEIMVSLTSNHIRVVTSDFTFTSKLVDGKFPDYQRVIPQNGDKEMVADRQQLKATLSRAAILTNEKFRGIRATFKDGNLQILANNPDQEEAEENMSVDYNYAELEIGFNVNYLLDVLNNLNCEQISIVMNDSNSSSLVKDFDSDQAVYVVMPMRL